MRNHELVTPPHLSDAHFAELSLEQEKLTNKEKRALKTKTDL